MRGFGLSRSVFPHLRSDAGILSAQAGRQTPLVGSLDQGEGAHTISLRRFFAFSSKFRTAAAELPRRGRCPETGSPKSEGAATHAGHGSWSGSKAPKKVSLPASNARSRYCRNSRRNRRASTWTGRKKVGRQEGHRNHRITCTWRNTPSETARTVQRRSARPANTGNVTAVDCRIAASDTTTLLVEPVAKSVQDPREECAPAAIPVSPISVWYTARSSDLERELSK